MSETVSLVPIRPGELEIGKPLRRPVYDTHGNLLLASGITVENQNQIDGLIEKGYFHAGAWGPLEKGGNEEAGGKPIAAMAPDGAGRPPEQEVVVDMADVRWHIGETIYLQVVDQSSLRYAVKLIGFVRNKTVFVTAPVSDGKFEFIREGQTFIVRAFSGKKAYAFMASAVKSVHAPHPYLHLTYPKQVRCNVVRQGARAEVRIIAALTVGERSGAGVLIDLSMGGAMATTKEALGAKGESGRVVFKLQAAGEDQLLNVEAVLRWIGRTESGDGFKHGFEFVNVGPHERLILSAFVHQTLVDAS